MPKLVAYLLGAGATQAEASFLGASPVSILMHDTNVEGLSKGILERANASEYLGDKGVDVEKLISLLNACGVNHLSTLAGSLRSAYFHVIRERLAEAQVLDRPSLAIALLQLHRSQQFQEVEVLSGLITTNHDGLFQDAVQNVFGAVDVGFSFRSNTFVQAVNAQAPLLLQLHGSFTWKFGVPLTIEPLRKRRAYSNDMIWLPPAILKESKSYPFNRLTAMAYEVLSSRCDVLRVIGASLTQNDWNVLSLIFNAQQHRIRTKGSPFRVELIMPHWRGEELVRECSYLRNLTPIGFLSEGRFDEYKDPETGSAGERANPFAYWLREKSSYHAGRNELGNASLGVEHDLVRGEIAA